MKTSIEDAFGTYCQAGNDNLLELKQDGTFLLKENGKAGSGRYHIEGQKFILEIEHSCTINGETIIDGFGRKWTKKH